MASSDPVGRRPRVISHMIASIDGRIRTDNGAMLRAGLVDEVSVLVAPVADGRIGSPALVDVEASAVTPRRLALIAVERRGDDVLWLRYRVA